MGIVKHIIPTVTHTYLGIERPPPPISTHGHRSIDHWLCFPHWKYVHSLGHSCSNGNNPWSWHI